MEKHRPTRRLPAIFDIRLQREFNVVVPLPLAECEQRLLVDRHPRRFFASKLSIAVRQNTPEGMTLHCWNAKRPDIVTLDVALVPYDTGKTHVYGTAQIDPTMVAFISIIFAVWGAILAYGLRDVPVWGVGMLLILLIGWRWLLGAPVYLLRKFMHALTAEARVLVRQQRAE